MTDRHARLSASSAHRWMNCAGSVALSEGEADKGSQAAAGGTADHVRYRPATRRVRVTDFKYGADVYVEVEDNVQLKKYALGVLLVLQAQNLMVEKVEMCVVQPRSEGARPVRTGG